MLSSSAFSPPPPRELAGAASGKAARNAPPPSPPIVVTERDIVFDCPNCSGELVIDQEGIGLTLACSHCGKPVTVPGRSQATRAGSGDTISPSRAAGAAESAPAASTFSFEGQTVEQISQRADELKRQLTENHSQTTEMRGHVNRATIELHRLQLKLQKLLDRQTAIEAEMAAAKAALEPSS
jgi:DNA-directed RNA polymerase subunit M/transcription elongation factor TFIIS